MNTGATASMLWPAGPHAGTAAEIGWVLIALCGVVFGAVMALVAWSLRRHAGPLSTTRWVVGGGVVFPVVVLSALWAYALWRGAPLAAPAPRDALIVSVTGHMWWWEVRLRDDASGREAVLANELRIPVGRPVRIGLTSADVIHSLWVPALTGKQDLIPGRVTHLDLTASRAGTFAGPCAEYCGTQHAHMTLQVVALAPDDFDAWFARQLAPAVAIAPAAPIVRAAPIPSIQPTAQIAPAAPAMTDDADAPSRGRTAFLAQRCNACHAVRGLDGAEAPAGVAPDLTHVGSRLQLGAGALANEGDALQRWIGAVQHYKPGARMPSYGHLDAETLAALGAYLASLH